VNPQTRDSIQTSAKEVPGFNPGKDLREKVVIVQEMIRRLLKEDFNTILEIINETAQAYKGVIPNDR